MRHTLRLLARLALYFFALIGVVTVAVYFAMQFDLLNVRGNIDTRNTFFEEAHRERLESTAYTAVTPVDQPKAHSSSTVVATSTPIASTPCLHTEQRTCPWHETPEWAVVKSGLLKDAPVLARVSRETGVSTRMIAAVVVPEQLRFFTSNREVFKRWFEPMKLLGSLSKFSLGVSGIKQETAQRIEEYALDPVSPFYPGDGLFMLVAHATGTNASSDIFARLTDEDNHYYSYLYTALYIREVTEQWKRAGYDIANNPEIIVTLFNLGFDHSEPKPDPQSGGAAITVGGTTYTYGILGGLFYSSDQLPEFTQE